GEEIRGVVRGKLKGFEQARLHELVALVVYTGVRIDEALTLRTTNVDYDNLLVTVFGKGRKERRVPFSFEARKVMFRWERVRKPRGGGSGVLCSSRVGEREDTSNSLRGG